MRKPVLEYSETKAHSSFALSLSLYVYSTFPLVVQTARLLSHIVGNTKDRFCRDAARSRSGIAV